MGSKFTPGRQVLDRIVLGMAMDLPSVVGVISYHIWGHSTHLHSETEKSYSYQMSRLQRDVLFVFFFAFSDHETFQP